MKPPPLDIAGQAATLARTLRSLHPLQIAARPYQLGARALISDVPALAPPRTGRRFPPPPHALEELREAERSRFAVRLSRLRPGSALRAYEEAYGLDLVPPDVSAAWRTSAAVHPYPASVRARSLAVAIRRGAEGYDAELARACRAVLLQPELHLLGNHLLENGIGLACGGAIASGHEAELWWRTGTALLDWQLRAQFLEDGGHFERSAAYHLALTAALLELIELARAVGLRPVPALWRDTASRALGWAAAVVAPDGSVPLFNDATLDAAPDFADVASLGRALDISWTEPTVAVQHLRQTGWVIARADDAFLVIDAGPDGAPHQPGHAHADSLSFELWVRGRRTVVDYGVSSYEPDEARMRTRATRSHNTVSLSGRDSSEVWSAFRVGRRCTAEVQSIDTGPSVARVRARHDGYRWMDGRPWHERELELSPGRLSVRDRITGGTACAVSHLRLDATAATEVRVSFRGSPAAGRPDAWYPCFSEPAEAVVFEAGLGRANTGEWTIEW